VRISLGREVALTREIVKLGGEISKKELSRR